MIAAIKRDNHLGEVPGKRGQILRELRRQIGVQGIAGITMRDLALASGVATKTLYNLFGSKDALISESVRDTYKSVMGAITQSDRDLDAFEQLISYASASAQFNLAEPIYTRAMIYAYYSADTSLGSFHQDFHNYIGGAFKDLLLQMRQTGDLQPWSPPHVIARQIVESLISTAAEWTKDIWQDEAFVDTSLLSVLSLLYVHLTDRLQSQVQDRIKELSKKLGDDQVYLRNGPDIKIVL